MISSCKASVEDLEKQETELKTKVGYFRGDTDKEFTGDAEDKNDRVRDSD